MHWFTIITISFEFKKSTSELKEGIISIASILNKHQKGRLIFGVKNSGDIVGQDVSENTLRKISKAVSDHIEPKIYPQQFFYNAKLRCAVFGTTDTSVTIDMQDFEGDLFYLINEAEKYFLKNIHIGMKVDGLRRVDVPEINKEAFREAIVNAFCHRDYWKFDSVNVAVFKDRVEVRSPGLLYGDLTIDKIKRENISERRNELISKLFYDVHYVENWGRGISKILSFEPDTDFKEVGTHFITVFRRKEVQKYPEKYPEKLNVTQVKMINIIKKEPNINRLELAKRLYLTDSAIKKNLRILKEKGVIKRVGPAKGGYWKVL